MDARPADSEPMPENSSSPYARAAARRFTHFSASRRDTRAQFCRWAAGESLSRVRKAGMRSLNELANPKPALGFRGLSTGDMPGLTRKDPRSSLKDPQPLLRDQRPSPDSGGGAARIPAREPGPPPREPGDEEATAERVPQWLHPFSRVSAEDLGEGATAETLAGAARRISSHWLLEEVFLSRPDSVHSPGKTGETPAAPALAAFSIAGGTGKTTLLATLGRVLAARGERVLLADTAPLSMAPCYFGAPPVAGRPGGSAGGGFASQVGPAFSYARSTPHDPASGSVRTFAPPRGRDAAAVDILSLGEMLCAGLSLGEEDDPVHKLLLNHGEKADRLLLDVQSGWEALARCLFWLKPVVLTPLLPHMNSVASVAAMEAAFASDLAAGAIKLIYLLNQFDSSEPLHLDVRAALERRLGDRLLPFVIRRGPEVSEALAEGMTVIDYAPGSPASEDYARLADWVRDTVPSVSRGSQPLRWSER